MTQPATIWECRYIVDELPTKLWSLLSARVHGLKLLAKELQECDCYLIGTDASRNIKLRYRSNALKMKSLLATEPDGLEAWQTDFDVRLPAPLSIWTKILGMMGHSVAPGALAKIATVAEAQIKLLDLIPAQRLILLKKVRSLYETSSVRLEVARFHLGSTRFETLCLEGEDSSSVRELVTTLATHELGRPCNYITILSRFIST